MKLITRAISRLNIALGVALIPSGGIATVYGMFMAAFGLVMWSVTQ